MKFKILLFAAIVCMTAASASAYEYSQGPWGMKLTGYGTAGMIEPDFETPVFIGDWRIRGQLNYAVESWGSVGLVYALDELALYQDQYARDAFVFMEDDAMGRIEFGFTDSIATKLGVGLPDVGGLRINDNPLFYKKTELNGYVISNTTTTSGRYYPRINVASAPTGAWQFGASFAGLTQKYNYAADLGAKYRHPDGKMKTALSLGASFVDAPENMQTDVFAPAVTADWRAQISAGLNLQYNSWIWGLSARAIYDQNPITPPSDGIVAGTGLSYDFLNYSLSASYLFSDVGIWHSDVSGYVAHTGLMSFRYKYSEGVDGWISLGMTDDTPFVSAGIRLKI